jgi:hypothetical protein
MEPRKMQHGFSHVLQATLEKDKKNHIPQLTFFSIIDWPSIISTDAKNVSTIVRCSKVATIDRCALNGQTAQEGGLFG